METNSYLAASQVRDMTVENDTSDETESELRWVQLKTGSSRLPIKRTAPETARPGQPRGPSEICFPNSAAHRGIVRCTSFAPAKKSQSAVAGGPDAHSVDVDKLAMRGQCFHRVILVISVEHTSVSFG